MTNLALDTKEQVLEAAIGGLPRVAEAVVAIPAEARKRALDAAEDSYRQTARNLDYGEAEVQEWVAAIMFRLRAEVAAQELKAAAQGLAEQKNKSESKAPSFVATSAA
jgi:hypothetical protein